MRYPKGAIDLRSPQDTLLLQQVLRSRYVSHEQLWEFMRYKGRECRRRVFNWRVKRLVDHELVLRKSTASRSWVYWVSHEGPVEHSLELNELQLALLRGAVPATWQSELEIRSLNEFTGYGFSKDYDAVVKVERDGRTCRFALECERSPKTPEKYARVRQALEKERQVDCVVYVMPAYPLLSYVATFFERCAMPVYFALSDDFQKNALGTPVMDSRRLRTAPLCAILDATPERDSA